MSRSKPAAMGLAVVPIHVLDEDGLGGGRSAVGGEDDLDGVRVEFRGWVHGRWLR